MRASVWTHSLHFTSFIFRWMCPNNSLYSPLNKTQLTYCSRVAQAQGCKAVCKRMLLQLSSASKPFRTLSQVQKQKHRLCGHLCPSEECTGCHGVVKRRTVRAELDLLCELYPRTPEVSTMPPIRPIVVLVTLYLSPSSNISFYILCAPFAFSVFFPLCLRV